MKNIFFGIFLMICCSINAQNSADSATYYFKQGIAKMKLQQTNNKTSFKELEPLLSDFSKAEVFYRQSEDSLSKLGVAKCLHYQATIYNLSTLYSNKRKVRSLGLEAIPVLEEFNQIKQAAAAYQYLGITCLKLGYLTEAKKALFKAVQKGKKIQKSSKKPPYRLSAAYRWLGIFYGNIEMNDSSLHYSSKALDIIEQLVKKGSSNIKYAELYHNKAVIELRLGQDANAQISLLQSRKYLGSNETFDGIDLICKSYFVEAKVFRENQDSVNSIQLLNKIASIYSKHNFPNYKLKLYNEYGSFFLHFQDTIQALAYYNKAIENSHNDDEATHGDKMATLNNLGLLHFSLGNITKGNDYFEEAFKLQKQYRSDTPDLADNLNKSAEMNSGLNEFQKALQTIQKAIAVNSNDINRHDTQYIPTSHSIIKNEFILLNSLYLKASILSSVNENKFENLILALSTIQTADTFLNRSILNLAFNEDKLNLIETYKKLYPLGVNICYELYVFSKDETFLYKAFYFTERSKSFTLNTEINLKSQLMAKGVKEIDIHLFQYNQERIKELLSRLKYEENGMSEDTKDEYIQQLDYLKKEVQLYKDENINDRVTTISTITEIQTRLNNHEAIINYAVLEDAILAFVITKEEMLNYYLSLTDDIFTKLKDFQNSFKSRYSSRFSKKGHELYKFLILPLKEGLEGKTQLIIIPHNNLYNFSFEALITQEKAGAKYNELNYMINDFDISYHYSASLWSLSKQDNKTNFETFYLGLAPFAQKNTSVTIDRKEHQTRTIEKQPKRTFICSN